MDIPAIISSMSLPDKVQLCTGADFWHTRAMPRYGIPAFLMADGPHGLRCQENSNGSAVHSSRPATCFPAAVTAGAAWDTALYAAEGEAIGREAAAAGVALVLGPGCNIKRGPLCGRNFEYLSEDPFLSGRLSAAFVKGQQGAGVSSCLKHFAANSQEFKRQNGDSRIDQRALREIYLTAFEMAVKEAQPGAVMCAYNKLNGVHCSDSRPLLDSILRAEWGFDGMVVTDWGALNDRVAAFRAGCDLNMPGGSHFMERAAVEAVRSGQLEEAAVDASVSRILRLALRPAPTGGFDWEAHDQLSCQVAERGAVLLKNEGGLLPVPASDLVLIGYMAEHPRYQGTGSSHINPARLTSLVQALPEAPYIPCCASGGEASPEELRRAAEGAGRARVAVVVAGLPELYESEGLDREGLAMPEGHVRMIEAVAAANPNTVVVLLGGGPMELPWADKVKAILYMGLPGQAGGRAAARLLTGRACPCGKLTESWPVTYSQCIAKETFGMRDPEYRESIYVGYRYYDKAGVAVRFPFGYGLSYTQFTYSGLKVDRHQVTAVITNTGSTAGAEVAQLYVAPPQGGIHRPEKELKGFARVELAPGESKEVSFPLDGRTFAVWADGWRTPGGVYRILVGASSRDIRLEGRLTVQGEAVPAPGWQAGSWYETMAGSPSRAEWEMAMGGPAPEIPKPRKGSYTLDNTCAEMMEGSRAMKLQYQITKLVISRICGTTDLSDPAYRMMLTDAVNCPLRALVINTGGRIGEGLVRCLLKIANSGP